MAHSPPLSDRCSKAWQVELRDLLEAGHDVVVDHGFWIPEDRAGWQAIAVDSGAIPVLIHLAADHDQLWARIRKAQRVPRGRSEFDLLLRGRSSAVPGAVHPPRETNRTSSTTAMLRA
ncbi:AAA family ATPase [Streptomyces sp. NPDC047081]|uniref:AAA family ATPase n=1 Tax=Streptomyces sp. NPDC047081 TaxID=3154706 RepID=UPI0033EDB7F3